MADKQKKTYINTTIHTELFRAIKILAAEEGKRLNQLLEEAIQDLIRKYKDKEIEENVLNEILNEVLLLKPTW